MNLADRTLDLQAEGAYAVLAKSQELERRGKKIVHLEIGQPDFPTPKHISKAGIDAIRKGLTKYNPPLGVLDLRKEVAKSFSKLRGKKLSFENVAITPGGKPGIFAVMALVINPGDEVIYPSPGFPTYEVLIGYFGGVKKPVPLLEENNFSFDMDAFASSISKKTKLIILNSPSNPTGSIIPKKDLEEIAKIARKNDIWIFSDEIYSKILYDNKKLESIWALPGMAERTFVLDGFSKTYSMTGWRLGYLACPLVAMEKIDYLLTHFVGCTATFIQHAGITALSEKQTDVKKMVKEFSVRRNYLVKALNNIDGISCVMPAGAFYTFPNISSFGKSSNEMADLLLEKAGVALLSGSAFGEFGEGYLRLSYATSLQKLKKAVKLISEILPAI